MTFYERFYQVYLAVANGKSAEFCRKTGLKSSTLATCIKRESVGLDVLAAILSSFPTLSAEWLLRGEGEMLKGQTITQDVGNGNSDFSTTGNVTDGVPLSIHEKALDEITEQRKLIAKGQEQIDKLLSIIEKISK